MNILLISPCSPDTYWSMKHALKFISKGAALPPLGLLTVASLLPRNWNLKLIDMAVNPLSPADIAWADYVFVSAMHIHTNSVKRIIKLCTLKGRPIVAGGPLFAAQLNEFDSIDHLVLGEAEVTLPLFLSDLEKGSPKHIYTSVEKADLQKTPVPMWKLLDLNRYALASIQYSRGCPFNCDFCNVTSLFGHKYRVKNASQITEELQAIYDTGYRGGVFFVDDNLIGNPRHLKTEILPAVGEWMKEKKRPFYFNTQASINLADDDELMHLMAHVGFNCVFVGIETPSQESLSECNKNQNRDRDLVACVKKIQRAGLEVQGGFILGFDSDTPSCFDNLISFIQQSGIVAAMVGLLNAPPGTKLYDRLASEQRLTHAGTGDNTDFTMNFTPVMEYNDLLAGYERVIGTIYSHRNYYERIRTCLGSFNLVSASRGFTSVNFMAFVKSIWKLGILDDGRLYYWKLLLWGIIHPRYFTLIVSFSITGFHFRKVFEELRPGLQYHSKSSAHKAHPSPIANRQYI